MNFALRVSSFLMLISLTACDAAVTSFVKGGEQPPSGVPQSGLDARGPFIFKMSPGQFTASAPNGAIRANVSLNERRLKAGDMSGQFSISRAHAKPQGQ